MLLFRRKSKFVSTALRWKTPLNNGPEGSGQLCKWLCLWLFQEWESLCLPSTTYRDFHKPIASLELSPDHYRLSECGSYPQSEVLVRKSVLSYMEPRTTDGRAAKHHHFRNGKSPVTVNWLKGLYTMPVSSYSTKSVVASGARGSVVVKELCYKPEGRVFETLWGEFLSFPNLSGRIMPWGSFSPKQKWVAGTEK
jgi:hypothetical protein